MKVHWTAVGVTMSSTKGRVKRGYGDSRMAGASLLSRQESSQFTHTWAWLGGETQPQTPITTGFLESGQRYMLWLFEAWTQNSQI